MQMHDALRHLQEGRALADLAEAFDLAPQQAAAALRAVASELAWHLEQSTLSHAGLADLVEALGGDHHARYMEGGVRFRDEAVRADGNAVLDKVIGSKDRSRALVARAARQAGVDTDTLRSMLPALAVVTMAEVAMRARDSLGEILTVMPRPGRWGRGSPHADLADILRRSCGAGPFARGKLRRVVRRALARAVGFRARGPVRWYLQFMLARPAVAPLRCLSARLLGVR